MNIIKLLNYKNIGLELDKNGCFSKQLTEHFIDRGLFQLFVPDSIKEAPEDKISGEKDFVKAVKTIEEYSKLDGNIGWILQIGAGAGVFAAYLENRIAKKYFSQSHQVVAGSGFPAGVAKPVKGGFQVSGSWRFASGAYHASIFTANCKIDNSKDTIVSVIIPADRVTILPVWNGMGMRATDSHTFVVEDVFIPEEDVFEIVPERLVVRSPLYRMPFDLFARALFIPVFLGMADDYIEVFGEFIREKDDDYSDKRGLLLEEFTISLKYQQSKFYRSLDIVWDSVCSENMKEGLSISFSKLCIGIKEILTTNIEKCHKYTGMEGVRMDSRINVIFRNFITAGAHYLLSPLLNK